MMSAGLVADARRGDMRAAPGLVRISLGCYNDRGDIDRVVEGLGQIVAGEVDGSYRQELDGSFVLATSDSTRRPGAAGSCAIGAGRGTGSPRRRLSWRPWLPPPLMSADGLRRLLETPRGLVAARRALEARRRGPPR